MNLEGLIGADPMSGEIHLELLGPLATVILRNHSPEVEELRFAFLNALMLLGHRYYDSTTGRFLSKDPARDRRNWIVYTCGNPVARSDEAGLQQRDMRGRGKVLVPKAPLGVNVRANAMEARRNGMMSRDMPFSWWATDSWFLNQVREGGEWDYKRRGNGMEYEPFGNFHYGVVSAAYGWSEPTALQAAGIVQVATDTSRPEWGTPSSNPPYGDDPRDQYWIKMGYRYYYEVIRKPVKAVKR